MFYCNWKLQIQKNKHPSYKASNVDSGDVTFPDTWPMKTLEVTSKHLSVTLLQLKHHKAAVKQTLKMLSFQQWEAENAKGNN